MLSSFHQARDLSEWSEAAVARYLRTYRQGVIPENALGPLINGRELVAKLNEPGLDVYLREAIIRAIEDPQQAWEECTRIGEISTLELGENASWLQDPLLGTAEESGISFVGDYHAWAVGFPPFFTKRSASLSMLILLMITLSLTAFAPKFAEVTGNVTVADFRRHVIHLISIPLIFSGAWFICTWVISWLLFYPVEFRGYGQVQNTNFGVPFGWRGLIPFRAGEKARIAVRMLKKFVITEGEVFGKLDPGQMAEILQRPLALKIEKVVEIIASEEAPTFWKAIPKAVKAEINKIVASEVPLALKEISQQMKQEIDELLVLEELVADIFMQDPQLCSDVFLACSTPELIFIRRSATALACGAGTIQLVTVTLNAAWWVLPFTGALYGLLINAIVFLMVFYPVESDSFCDERIRVQGRILQRQAELSQTFAFLVAKDVITVPRLLCEVVNGKGKVLMRQIVRDGIFRTVEMSFAPFTSIIPMAIQQRIVDRTGQMVNDSLLEILMEAEDYLDRAFDLRRTLAYRMARLDHRSFQAIFWNIFRDEFIPFCGAGAVVGFLAGLVQLGFQAV